MADERIKHLCLTNDLEGFKNLMLEYEKKPRWHPYAMFRPTSEFSDVCFHGKIEFVHYMIRNYPSVDLNDGLYYACHEGHLDIVQLLIKRGANAFNEVFEAACGNGHLEVVKLLVNKGATNLFNGFSAACSNGELDIVNYLIGHGVDDWNRGLRDACRNGQLEVAKLMVANGADDFNAGLRSAIAGDNGSRGEKLIQLMTDNLTHQESILHK